MRAEYVGRTATCPKCRVPFRIAALGDADQKRLADPARAATSNGHDPGGEDDAWWQHDGASGAADASGSSADDSLPDSGEELDLEGLQAAPVVIQRQKKPDSALKRLSPEQLRQKILAGFRGPIEPVRRSLLYRCVLTLLGTAIIVLPLAYIGAILIIANWTYQHATGNTWMLFGGVNLFMNLFLFMLYVWGVLAGLVTIAFLCKPFLPRRSREPRRLSLNRTRQPVLFAFVDQICETLRTPKPTQIDVALDGNAAVGLFPGKQRFQSELVLQIGLPLVSVLTLQQFAGVLAHEFGHLSQGMAMRLDQWTAQIQQWFARAVLDNDDWDDWLSNLARDLWPPLALCVYLAQFAGLVIRSVPAVFFLLSTWLRLMMSQLMEFDADRFEARLVGSDTFEETIYRLMELHYAVHRMAIGQFAIERATGNITRDALTRCQELTDAERQNIRRKVRKMKVGWFSTHPSFRSRIDSVKRSPNPGVFQSDLPATVVFQNFDELCLSLQRA